MTLPTHVATDDEAIPPLLGRPLDGADLRLVQPAEEMVRDLGHYDSLDDYVDRFEEHLETAGIDASVMIDVDSDEAAPSFREDCAPLFRDDVAPFGLGPYRH